MKQISVNVNETLHKQLKHVAVERDTTVTALIVQCAERIVKEVAPQPTLTTEEKPAYIADSPVE